MSTMSYSEDPQKYLDEKNYKKYDKMELQHLYHNFTSFGVDAVLECICENEKLKHQNKK